MFCVFPVCLLFLCVIVCFHEWDILNVLLVQFSAWKCFFFGALVLPGSLSHGEQIDEFHCKGCVAVTCNGRFVLSLYFCWGKVFSWFPCPECAEWLFPQWECYGKRRREPKGDAMSSRLSLLSPSRTFSPSTSIPLPSGAASSEMSKSVF